jgi:hypothetical protein
METGYCERHHQIWWAEWNGKRTAFVKIGRAFRLETRRTEEGGSAVTANPVAFCYRLHSEICPSYKFSRRSPEPRGQKRRTSTHAYSCPYEADEPLAGPGGQAWSE